MENGEEGDGCPLRSTQSLYFSGLVLVGGWLRVSRAIRSREAVPGSDLPEMCSDLYTRGVQSGSTVAPRLPLGVWMRVGCQPSGVARGLRPESAEAWLSFCLDVSWPLTKAEAEQWSRCISMDTCTATLTSRSHHLDGWLGEEGGGQN